MMVMKKEIAVNDRMCPCVARWSMIAIVIYLCVRAVNDRHVYAGGQRSIVIYSCMRAVNDRHVVAVNDRHGWSLIADRAQIRP